MSKNDLHIIYLTTCDYTDKKYVGRHKVSNLITLDPSYIGTGSLITKLIKKYGKKSFHRIILCKIRTNDLEKVRKLERYYISKHNTLYPNGLNWLNGDLDTEENPMYMSQNKRIVSENSKKMRGENNPMYGKHHSEETKRLMSISRSGENNPWFGVTGVNNPFFGKPKSEEHKDKIRQACLGRKLSEETKRKISETRKKRISEGKIKTPAKGKKLSEETRRKISQNHARLSGISNPNYGKHILRGNKNGMWGKHISDEQKEIISKVHKGKRYMWITNGVENLQLPLNSQIPNGFRRGKTNTKQS